MKIILVILLSSVPFMTHAQKASKQVENKSDTVITKDPLTPGREYWVIHNLKGNISSQGFMLQGKKDGTWREYYDGNSALSKIAEYKGDTLNGIAVTVSASGSVQTEETYMNGKKNGLRISYSYFGGRMKLLENYTDDILNGTKKTFYEDGKIQEESNYKNGKRDGVVTWFLQNGSPSMEYTYENGQLQGPAKVFDENGKIKQEGIYRNDNEEGEWKEYKDSVLVKKIIYRQGQILKEVQVKK